MENDMIEEYWIDDREYPPDNDIEQEKFMESCVDAESDTLAQDNEREMFQEWQEWEESIRERESISNSSKMYRI